MVFCILSRDSEGLIWDASAKGIWRVGGLLAQWSCSRYLCELCVVWSERVDGLVGRKDVDGFE